nr:hypothetical protein [Tanacetum cinerariifolium]
MPAVKSKVLAPGRYVVDVEPIPPRIRNNREVHLDYLKHLKESVKTLREIVEEAKHAVTPVTRKKQVTFMDPCETSTNNTLAHVKKQTIHQTNELVIPFTGVKGATAASGSKPRSNTKKDGTLPAKCDIKKVEVHPRNKNSSVQRKNRIDSSLSYKRTSVTQTLVKKVWGNWEIVCRCRTPKEIGDPMYQTLHFRLFSNAGRTDRPLVFGLSKGSGQALSISKMKVARYLDFGLEQLVPEHMWINKV